MLGLVKKSFDRHLRRRAAGGGRAPDRLKAQAKLTPNKARLAEIQKEKEAWKEELAKWPSPNEKGRIGPRQALAALARAMPKNAMVSTDIGNVCSVANSYLHFETAPSFLAAMSFGNCGYAYPAAIGAKVGRPDRPAIAYVGDGAWGMSLNEVMTCVRENIPAIAVVFNNGQWGAEKKNQVDYFEKRYLGTNLKNPNFADVAEAMGANGITVDHVDEIGDALRGAVKSNKPTVINMMLTQELGDPFRRDAFRQPRRLLRNTASTARRSSAKRGTLALAARRSAVNEQRETKVSLRNLPFLRRSSTARSPMSAVAARPPGWRFTGRTAFRASHLSTYNALRAFAIAAFTRAGAVPPMWLRAAIEPSSVSASKTSFADELRELLELGELELGEVLAAGFGMAHRLRHRFVRFAERQAFLHEIVGEVGRGRVTLPRRFAHRAAFTSSPPSISVNTARLVVTVSTVSKSGSLSSWLSLL